MRYCTARSGMEKRFVLRIIYMMFEMKAKEMIGDLIKILTQESPFAQIESNSVITNGLLKIYRHLINQNLD